MKKFIGLILACCVVVGMLPLTVFASMDDETTMSDEVINNVSVWSGRVADSFSGGSGTKNDPYQISTAAELAKQNANIHFSFFSGLLQLSVIYCVLPIKGGTHNAKNIHNSISNERLCCGVHRAESLLLYEGGTP